jgi:O-acetyl-ADP-ribose deacetylase (regulator of RNase III)
MSEILRQQPFPTGQRLLIVQGDITHEPVDAIVNAANSTLQHGGGVAGIIVSRGGREIQIESNRWVREHGPVSHDQPAYTTGGRLPCKTIIHAVGPVWGSGNEDTKLRMAISSALRLSDQLNIKSIAFPAISTGIFGFPKKRAARIIFETIEAHFHQNPASGLEEVRLTLYDQPTVEAFTQVWDTIEPTR